MRYIYNNDILEDLPFCQPLHGRTTWMDIFQKVSEFLTKVGLVWTNCVGVCYDGAAATIVQLGFMKECDLRAMHLLLLRTV